MPHGLSIGFSNLRRVCQRRRKRLLMISPARHNIGLSGKIEHFCRWHQREVAKFVHSGLPEPDCDSLQNVDRLPDKGASCHFWKKLSQSADVNDHCE